MKLLRDLVLLRARIDYPIYWASIVVLLAILFGGVFLFASIMSNPGIAIVALAVIVGIAWLMVCAARCRDIEVSPLCGLLTLVPVVGVIALFWLGLSRGKPL